MNVQPIGAFSRLVSDTGRSLLRRDDSGLSWSIKKEQMDHHFFSFVFDETVHHSQRCSFSDQNNNFLILTNTHVIVLSENLEQLMIWEVGNSLFGFSLIFLFKNDRIDLTLMAAGDNDESCIVLQELNDDRVSRYIQSNAPYLYQEDAFRIRAKYNSLFITSFNKIKFSKSEKGFIL